MKIGRGPKVTEVDARAAWEILSKDRNARFVDVRTRPEWGFVGGPDLSEVGHSVMQIEWSCFPDMERNTAFPETLMEELGGHVPTCVLFLCRSGVRSMHAAMAAAEAFGERGLSVECINVAEGFEGDLCQEAHRGGLNGWKARGLAWRQT